MEIKIVIINLLQEDQKQELKAKKGSYNRSKIPTELCKEIIECSILAVV